MVDIDKSLARHLSGEPLEEEELLKVNRWKEEHPREFEQLGEWFNQSLVFDDFSLENGEKLIHNRIAKKKNRGALLLIAASVSLLLSAAALFYLFGLGGSRQVALLEKTTVAGQKSEIPLRDGSLVRLNSNSSLTYPEEFKNERRLKMTGEAFFDVTRDPQRPFIIQSGDMEVKVLGTSFNINASMPGQFILTVTSGVVQLVGQTGEYLVTKDHQLHVNMKTGQVLLDSGSFAGELAWLEDKLVFNGDSIGIVVKKLENWYGVTITLQNDHLKNCQITGEFQGESLQNVLRMLKFTSDIDYEIEGKEVRLFGEGCSP